ncbi:MAG: DNA translocase FtsK 4TM domain-containing protein, partial [Sulfurimicrobium sp.]|nr:DNA translocase FtsK 4TM domain-containing protein [Sulfurimicrobium sp.]
MRESWWLVLVVAALYFIMILGTYDRGDPGWSHSVTVSTIHNAGGELGAWLADLFLYLFGLSAYWWAAFFLFAIAWGYRRIDSVNVGDRRSLLVAFVGFIILLVASSGVEALRLYSLKVALPLAPGGMLGAMVSDFLWKSLGFTGATLLMLVTMAIGLSFFIGLSWLELIERIGGWVEDAYSFVVHLREARQDRLAGKEAEAEREQVVTVEKKRMEEQEPIRIQPPAFDIPKSERSEREKQAPLFENMPDSPLPPLHLLDETEANVEFISPETLEYTSRLIERKLADFGVEVKVVAAYHGPVITRYEIEPAGGVKGSQIMNLIKDLARALSVVSIRVVETIPGKHYMGLELPNPKRQIVRLSEILSSKAYAGMNSPLTIAMGKDIGGQPVVADLAKMPHALVAGTTGSGKSVAVNAMILSLLYKAEPSQVRLIMVDPKMLELSIYEGIPHLLAPVVTDMKHAANALNWCVAE